jgi:hypothetical protein
MYIGIVCLILALGMYIIMAVRDILWDKSPRTWMAVFTIIFGFVGIISFILPSFYCPKVTEAPYSIDIGSRLYFKDYKWAENGIVIPSHYYRQYSWVDTWEYCDTPITIVVPEGQKVIINDLRPQARPYIIGGCK